MIKAFPGGWDAICGALGLSRNALENRIYERKGQGVEVELALQIQTFTGTTHFAEAVALKSGGVFLRLPADLNDDNEEIGKKFRELNTRLGSFCQRFDEAIANDEIDKRERADLELIANGMQKTISELLALSFRVYCEPDAESGE